MRRGTVATPGYRAVVLLQQTPVGPVGRIGGIVNLEDTLGSKLVVGVPQVVKVAYQLIPLGDSLVGILHYLVVVAALFGTHGSPHLRQQTIGSTFGGLECTHALAVEILYGTLFVEVFQYLFIYLIFGTACRIHHRVPGVEVIGRNGGYQLQDHRQSAPQAHHIEVGPGSDKLGFGHHLVFLGFGSRLGSHQLHVLDYIRSRTGHGQILRPYQRNLVVGSRDFEQVFFYIVHTVATGIAVVGLNVVDRIVLELINVVLETVVSALQLGLRI